MSDDTHYASIPTSRTGHGDSKCGRCLVPVAIEFLQEFLQNDHLCRTCAGVPDSVFADSLVQAERASKTKNQLF